ncbi:MAG: regulatory protein RecX [Acidobacteriaceae bacterium]|nr:regulatory protein RecX [Acidobacteriaceae bacterium]
MAAVHRPKKLDPDALWNYALRLLGDRAQATAQLRKKLVLRAQSPSDVTSVMAKLCEYGLTDDKKFSESFASSRLANQGFGRFRVLRDLRSKQVASSVAEEAVGTVFAETDEHQLAEDFLLRKYRGKELASFLSEEKNLAAAYRRLRTAGFSSNVTLSVLKRFSRCTEAIEETEEPPEPSA